MLEEGWGHSLLLINYQEVEGASLARTKLGDSWCRDSPGRHKESSEP